MKKVPTSRRGMVPTNPELKTNEKRFLIKGIEHEKSNILLADIMFDGALVKKNAVFCEARDYMTRIIELPDYNKTKEIVVNAIKIVGHAII